MDRAQTPTRIYRGSARRGVRDHGLGTRCQARIATQDEECVSCQTTPNNWFTAVHRRATPDRILAGTSDTGIVWITEAIEARRAGKAVGAVRLPPADSLRDDVAYAVCALGNGVRRDKAARFLAFLATAEAQSAYGKFSFAGATRDELQLKPIP
jgi:hypothetical protein